MTRASSAKPLLTRAEVAKRLGVSMSTVRRLGAAGKITEIRAGIRAIRIDPASVEKHLRAAVTGPGDQ